MPRYFLYNCNHFWMIDLKPYIIYCESLWWKLFKNNKRTQIQRQRQWQRQRQRQRHRETAWKTQHMLHFWNPDDLLIPNMMIDTSPWSSCSCLSPWLGCSGHTFSSTGPSVSPFWNFFVWVSKSHLPPNMHFRLIYLKFLLVLKRHSWEGQS